MIKDIIIVTAFALTVVALALWIGFAIGVQTKIAQAVAVTASVEHIKTPVVASSTIAAQVENIIWIRDPVVVKEVLTEYSVKNKTTIKMGLAWIIGDTCFIYALQPEDWEDKRGKEIVGEEYMHCNGLLHE